MSPGHGCAMRGIAHLLMVEGDGTAAGPSTALRAVPLPSKSRGGFKRPWHFPYAPPIAQRMPATLYSRDILRLAASIPHLGRLAHPQASVEKSSPVCGSRVVVDVAVDEMGRIVALGQEVRPARSARLPPR